MRQKKTIKERIRARMLLELKKLEPYLSDELYLQIRFRLRVGYWPNLTHPKTFNEKLNWLKLHNKRPEYTQMVDKVLAKDFVAGIIGSEYIIPTLGVWNSVEEINWESLPNQFVIKNSGDSGGVVVCKDKQSLNIDFAKKKLLKGFETDYFKYNKEYPYKDVRNRIIAEAYMEDESGFELKDYKIFCFNGVPKILFVASDRQIKEIDTKFDFFDIEWNHLPFTNGHPNSKKQIEQPRNFDKMLVIAEKLAKKINAPQVRIDLYNCDGKIYFGEITFFHWSGMTAFDPVAWDLKLGEYFNVQIDD